LVMQALYVGEVMGNPSQFYRVLIKFMDEQYVNSFIDDGLLFMNNIEYFRKYEGEENGELVRSDMAEGLAVSMQSEKVNVTFNGLELGGLTGNIDVRYNHEDKTNIYSMTRISDQDILDAGELGLYLSKKFQKFGNKAVLIAGKNIEKFHERLEEKINNATDIYTINESNIIAAQVEYVRRDEHHGNMGVFRKFDSYAWQHEWRIAFKNNQLSGPYSLKLGSLKDIAIVFDTETLISEPLKFTVRENI
ncbi:hypothetical protein, partial [Aliivibrio sp. 1S128]|uniref:hypothetical protein n=1 Tax=Aliivibrio sp. 1S128 TaxID=1840085 RepID=UPI001C4006DB